MPKKSTKKAAPEPAKAKTTLEDLEKRLASLEAKIDQLIARTPEVPDLIARLAAVETKAAALQPGPRVAMEGPALEGPQSESPPPIPISTALTPEQVFAHLRILVAAKFPTRDSVDPLIPLVGPPPALAQQSDPVYLWTLYDVSSYFSCMPRIAYGQNFAGNSVVALATAIYTNRKAQTQA